MRFFAAIVLLVPFLAVAEGSLYLDPPRGSYEVGDVFEVRVRADTGGELINAAEADLTFDTRALSVERISTDGSILASFSTNPSFSNDAGTVSFSGWTDEPFTGSEGLLLTISFKALRTITSNAHLAAGAILSVNGGSNIISSMKSGLYAVEPKQIVVESEVPQPVGVDYETPPAPIFTEYAASLAVGDRIVIQGIAIPDATVTIHTLYENEESVASVISAADGTFTYAGEPVKEGVYRIFAVVESAGGWRSESSRRIAITVQPKGYAGLATAFAGFLWAVLPFIAILIFGGLGFGYLLHRRSVHVRKNHAS